MYDLFVDGANRDLGTEPVSVFDGGKFHVCFERLRVIPSQLDPELRNIVAGERVTQQFRENFVVMQVDPVQQGGADDLVIVIEAKQLAV